jgi:N-acetylated-alpha-linked acidic dipeptidase
MPLQSRRLAWALLLGFPSMVGGQQASSGKPIRGFTPAAARQELRIEDGIARSLSPDSVRKYHRFLTEQPHVAGTPRNRELADYMVERFRAYGLEDVRLNRYDVLLPYPDTVSVTMLEPFRYEASLKEDPYPDGEAYGDDIGLAYLGMSASGDVTGELVYASSGNPEDYDWLEAHGIELEGKIAIVRYSVPYSYRGFKALTAERRGLKALIIYSDPADDGYRKGLTYPDGPWGPESHIQRGSITYDFIVPGDPLTPGWASVDGARRIPLSEARSVPKMITVPLSYREARPLLESLGGPVAPQSWQGALPFTYRVGPGATRVRVNVQMDGGTRSIWVAEGRIRGAEAPEQLVVLGNHRDAWVFGGVDPSSGTATQIELARVLGGMLKEGHRPRRTIVLASWDAEEWHLTGSTEWGEQFAEELGRGGVAYLNVDASTSGPEFVAGAVASLNRLIVETVRDVADPNTGGSVLEAWGHDLRTTEREAVIGGGAGTGDPQELDDPLNYVGNELGSGSDYTVFLNFLGLPIVEMSFNGPYGVYHSQYDNFHWVERFGDPGFRYMTTMSEVWGRMALRLANAEVLPFDLGLYAGRVQGFLAELKGEPGVEGRLRLSEAEEATADWALAAGTLEARVQAALTAASEGTPLSFPELNRALLGVERGFLLEEGIPDRPWFKHALYAPRYTYAPMMLPGLREGIERGDWALAQEQVDLLTQRLRRVAQSVRAAAETLPPANSSPKRNDHE